jgi:hypothetical protein
LDPLIKRRRGLTALVVLDVVKTLAHSAYREAVSWFEQALTALHPLPDTRQKIERGIDLRLDIRQSLFPLGELTTALRYLREAEELARTLDDPRRLPIYAAITCTLVVTQQRCVRWRKGSRPSPSVSAMFRSSQRTVSGSAWWCPPPSCLVPP